MVTEGTILDFDPWPSMIEELESAVICRVSLDLYKFDTVLCSCASLTVS